MFYIKAQVHNTWYYLCIDFENVTFMFPRLDIARRFDSRESAEHWMHEVADLPVCRNCKLELALS